MSEEKFDASKSMVSEDSMAKWLYAPLSEDTKSVPGIGPVAAKKLEEIGIETTHQLLGVFLSFKKRGTTPKEQCDAFWEWLRDSGISIHRNTIVAAVAGRVDLFVPGSTPDV